MKTYSGLGVAKEGVIKAYHSIAFAGNRIRKQHRTERPRGQEQGMMSPIRINIRPNREAPHEMTRIDFSKVYTIQHDVKVLNYGDIHSDYLHTFKSHWKDVVKDKWEEHEGEARGEKVNGKDEEQDEEEEHDNEDEYLDESSQEEGEKKERIHGARRIALSKVSYSNRGMVIKKNSIGSCREKISEIREMYIYQYRRHSIQSCMSSQNIYQTNPVS